MIRTAIVTTGLALLLSSGVLTPGSALAAGEDLSPEVSQFWQAGDPERGRGGPGGRGHKPGRQMRQHIEQLRMLKLLELLNLDDDQEVGFLIAYHRAKKNITAVEDSLRQQVDKLADGLKQASLSDGEILEMIARIDRLETARLDRLRQLREEVQPILTAEQQGKVVVFLHRFEEELLRQVRAFREHGGKGRLHPQPNDDTLGE
jgi:hypothetical protein